MGIPSYFSYIVKNHANIIKRLENLGFPLSSEKIELINNDVINDDKNGLIEYWIKTLDNEIERAVFFIND